MRPTRLVHSPVQIYAAFARDRSISLLSPNKGGDLSEVGNWQISGIALPIAVRHDGLGVFVGTFSDDGSDKVHRIDSFRRDPQTGALTPLGTVETAGRMTHISTDHTDRFLLGASYFANCIVTHPILPDGQLAELDCQLPTGKNAHHILLDQTNRYALVPNLGDSQIMQLQFDPSTGQLTYNAPKTVKEPTGAGCRHVAHHPNGRFVYLVNERDGSVVCFPYTGGKLGTPKQREFCLPYAIDAPWAAQILVTPDGQQLFVSERRTHSLVRWKINPDTGAISDRQIVHTSKNPRSFDIDPTGHWLFLAGLDSDAIETYEIGRSDGVPVRIATTPCRGGPTWLVIVPAGAER